jgi:iron(III) transport system substrate-binding protein
MPLTLAPVGMLSDAPHPNAARLFMDFILSQEGQRLLDTDLYGMYSMRPDVPPPPGQQPLAEVHPLLPTNVDDYLKASRDFPRHFEELFH